MKEKDTELLARLPINEILQELLMEYNDQASTGVTPSTEIKDFLPRYLELITDFHVPSHSMEICLNRLNSMLDGE